MLGFSLYLKSSKESITAETLLCESRLSSLNRHFIEPQASTSERTECKTFCFFIAFHISGTQSTSERTECKPFCFFIESHISETQVGYILVVHRIPAQVQIGYILTLRKYIFKQDHPDDDYSLQTETGTSQRKSLRIPLEIMWGENPFRGQEQRVSYRYPWLGQLNFKSSSGIEILSL